MKEMKEMKDQPITAQDIQAMLKLRELLKTKKPTFLRQDAHRIKAIAQNWRAPKGYGSKMRKKKKGHRLQPSVGWSSPRAVRGLSPEGFKIITINNVQDLEKNYETYKNKKYEIAFAISSTVGLKKKLAVVKKAIEKNLRIINIKDMPSFVNRVELLVQKKRVEAQQKTEEEKKKAKIVVEKEEALKKGLPEKELSLEEKAKQEKELKRKVLEKGQ